MGLTSQISTGIACGLILGFFITASSIKAKEQNLAFAFSVLVEALNIRYFKLKNVLGGLRKYMNEFHFEIDSLFLLLDGAIQTDGSIGAIKERLYNENNINYKFEAIKTAMSNYPLIQNDIELNNFINALIKSETSIGKAINAYNARCFQYKVFIEIFPVSLAARILNKKQYIPFHVATANEFDDNYIDEDEI